MQNKEIKYSTTIGLLTALVLVFFERSWALGVLLGCLCYALYFFLLSYSINDLTSARPTGGLLVSLGPVLRLFVLAIPLLVSFLVPEMINTFGVMIGLLLFKITAIIMSLIEK